MIATSLLLAALAQVTFDPFAGSIATPEKPPAAFVVSNAGPSSGRYVASERFATPDGWLAFVDPSPPAAGLYPDATLEPVALIFADGFETWWASPWSAGIGQTVYEMTEGGRVVALRAGELFWVLDIRGALVSDRAVVEDFLLSNVFGASAATDTPASKPYRVGLQPTTWVSWAAYERREGEGFRRASWVDIGGVVKHPVYTFNVSNHINPETKVGLLDDLELYDFRRQEWILYACRPVADGQRFRVPDLDSSDCKIAGRGTILDASFETGGRDVFSASCLEQTEDGLSAPTTPIDYKGLARGVTVEEGGPAPSGPEIRRPDVASLRGSGDQWFAISVLRETGDAGASDYTFITSGVARWIRSPSADTLITQMRNAVGTWQTVGTSPSFPDSTILGILINYDAGTSTASLYVDGVAAGSKVITGGLFAAPATDLVFSHKPSVGVMAITHFFFRHGSRELAAEEIDQRANYAIIPQVEADMDCALEFSAGVGDVIADFTGTQPATLNSFADVDGSWVASGTGEASMARSRPLSILGQPFQARLSVLDLAFQIYTVGYDGGGAAGTRSFRYVTSDGARTKPNIAPHAPFSNTWKSVGRQVYGIPGAAELAIGQIVTFFPDPAPGTNSGDWTISEHLADPVNVVGVTPVSTVIVEEPVTDATENGTWADKDDADWEDYALLSSKINQNLPVVRILSIFGDRLGAMLRYALPDFTPLATAAVQRLGPTALVFNNNLQFYDLHRFGWQGAGEEPLLHHLPSIAKSTPSLDHSPSVVYRSNTGIWTVRGADRSPSAADYTWGDQQIRRASPVPIRARFESVRVRYARNYTWTEGHKSVVPALSTRDRLAAESATEWREVTAGSGSPELIVEAFMMSPDIAQPYADALLDIAANGNSWRINLYPPRPLSEVNVLPFQVADVTYRDGSSGYLAAGRLGTIIGYAINPDQSADAIVLFIGD